MKLRAFLLVLICCLASQAHAAGILLFTQAGCQPCARMRPVVARLKARGVKVVEVDATQSQVATRLKIETTPTFVAVTDDGRELGRIVGATTEEKLAELARGK